MIISILPLSIIVILSNLISCSKEGKTVQFKTGGLSSRATIIWPIIDMLLWNITAVISGLKSIQRGDTVINNGGTIG